MVAKCRSWKDVGSNRCLLLKLAPDFLKDWALDVAVPVTVKNYKNVRSTAVVYICIYIYSNIRKIDREKGGLDLRVL